MYIVSLVFFGFAVRKYKDRYIPAALSMMLWFLVSALTARPTELLMPYVSVLAIVEKIIFAAMTVLLVMLCILRKRPLRLDWVPLIGTILAAAIRIGWFCCYHRYVAALGSDPFLAMEQLAVINAWKDFLLQAALSAVAVWHIYWISRPRFIK